MHALKGRKVSRIAQKKSWIDNDFTSQVFNYDKPLAVFDCGSKCSASPCLATIILSLITLHFVHFIENTYNWWRISFRITPSVHHLAFDSQTIFMRTLSFPAQLPAGRSSFPGNYAHGTPSSLLMFKNQASAENLLWTWEPNQRLYYIYFFNKNGKDACMDLTFGL